jgi:hypothetical protein
MFHDGSRSVTYFRTKYRMDEGELVPKRPLRRHAIRWRAVVELDPPKRFE